MIMALVSKKSIVVPPTGPRLDNLSMTRLAARAGKEADGTRVGDSHGPAGQEAPSRLL